MVRARIRVRVRVRGRVRGRGRVRVRTGLGLGVRNGLTRVKSDGDARVKAVRDQVLLLGSGLWLMLGLWLRVRALW